MNFKFKKRHLSSIAVCLSGCLYLNSLFGDFVYDDSRAIVTNPDVIGSDSLLKAFTNDYWGTDIASSNSHGSYRPISVLTLRLNYSLTGGQSVYFHATNMLLHSVVTWLYMRTLSAIIVNRRIVGLSSILFACHPIHVEAVSSLVGRAELLAALFFLLSILSYMRYCHENASSSIPRQIYLYLCCIFGALSMLSKEHGILSLPVCALYHLFFVHRLWPFSYKSFERFFKQRHFVLLRKASKILSLFTFALLLFRTWIANFQTPKFSTADNPTSKSPSVITRFLTFLYLPIFNFYLLIYPQRLSFDWSMDSIQQIRSFKDLHNISTLFFYLSIVLALFKIFKFYKNEASENHENPIPEIADDTSNTKEKQLLDDFNNNNSSSINYNFVDYSNNNNNNESNFDINNENNNNNNNEQINDDNGNSSSFPNLMKHYELTHPFIPAPQKYPSGYVPPEPILKKPSPLQKLKRKRTRTTQLDLVMLGLILTIVPFIPATNLFFYVGFVVAERILYIPSFGYCLLVGIGYECLHRRLPHMKTILQYCFTVTVIALAFRTFERNFDWNSEEQLYRSGLEMNPAKAYANLGSALDLKGNKHDAESAYRKALIYRPNMADVHYNLGLLCQGQKRYEEAVVFYQNAISFRPKLAQAYLNLGWILAKQGHILRAMELYRKCSKIDPSGMKNVRELVGAQIGALYNLGKLHAEASDHEKAISVFLHAIDRLPDAGEHYLTGQLFNIVGETFLKMNRTSDAELWFRRAIALTPKQLSSQLTWAKFLVHRNRTTEAEKVYLAAMKTSPNDTAVYEHYGHFLSRLQRYEMAFEVYYQGFLIQPANYEIVIGLADTLRELKKNDDAEKYYEFAVKLRSDEPRAYSNLGAIYHLNGKYELARQNYMIALKLRPEDNITQINLARLNNRSQQK